MKARPQKPQSAAPHPFSRPFDTRRLPEGGLSQAIEAGESERAALAASLGLPAIPSLLARFELRRRAGGRVVVTGVVDAVVTQSCVVTLEPFDSRISQAVELVFAAEAAEPRRPGRRGREDEVGSRPVPGSDDQSDPPEPLVDDSIDLGAIAAEFLALGLDPYPRRPGIAFDDIVDPADVEEPSAFAALERLKAKP